MIKEVVPDGGVNVPLAELFLRRPRSGRGRLCL